MYVVRDNVTADRVKFKGYCFLKSLTELIQLNQTETNSLQYQLTHLIS